LQDNKLGLSTTTVRGDAEDAFAQGLLAMKEENFTQATNFFEGITPTSEQYTEAQLYLSYIAYQQKNYAAAIDKATIVRSSDDLVQRQKAEWLQIQAMLANRQTDQNFQNLLVKIATENRHLFQKEAIQLQKDMNSIWRKIIF